MHQPEKTTSIDVVEKFFGGPLDEELFSLVAQAPDDQFVELVDLLSESWNRWLDLRIKADAMPDGHYFIGETHSGLEPLPLEKYKQLVMYFPSIAAPDPLEAPLATHVLMAQVFPQVLSQALRQDFLKGLRRLMEVTPLVRTGAIELVPALQARLSDGVQEKARNTVAALGTRAAQPSVDESVESLDDFVWATGLCTLAGYWPVAASDALWARLRQDGQWLATELTRMHSPVEEAVAVFDLPSVSRVPTEDLLRLRANEAAFADFRDAFGVAMREAADQGRVHGDHFAVQLLRDRLMPHQARCEGVAKGTSAFDGLMLPAGAALSAGGLAWALATGDDPMLGFENVKKLLIGMAAPGIAWLSMREAQRRFSKRDPALSIYSALIDKD